MKKAAAPAIETFLVRFEVNGRKWEERIQRPVTDAAVAATVRRRTRRRVTADENGDYGGDILVRGVLCGRYFIVPGSNKAGG